MNNLVTQFADEVKTVFLDETQFAEWFVWTHSGTAKRIRGLWARPYEAVNVALHLEASQPTIRVATADIAGLVHGDTLERESDDTIWKVYRQEPGVNGLTNLAVVVST